MSNGVGTGDGPDAVWRQGSLKPGHEWEQGCLPLELIFYRIQGSDSTVNGVFSLFRWTRSPWFSYFKAFRGIAERVFLVFWSEF